MEKTRFTKLPINGQGIFIYTVKHKTEFGIFVTPKVFKKDDGSDWISDGEINCDGKVCFEEYIGLRVSENLVRFVIKEDKDKDEEILSQKFAQDVGIETGTIVSYWFSYDRDNLTLKYGKGHIMEKTTLFVKDFFAGTSSKTERDKIREKYHKFFNADTRKYVVVTSQKMVSDIDEKSLINVIPRLQFRDDPFVCDYPPLVKDSSEVTLFDLDRDQYMLSSSLPQACQELYGNIKSLVLEYPENPIMKLSDAIRYSIETPGMTLFKKLKEKEGEFSYLRVTLGPDLKTAPGIPYVMEIWPAGRGSPIHNHGGSCAIIKNLFGMITVNIFNKLTKPPNENQLVPIQKFDLKEDQVTWISPNWYQTHRLMNNTNDFCVTIQSYRYQSNDTIHWPGFDCVDFVQKKQHYELEEFRPNSDFTFVNLRSIVLKEYKSYLERQDPYGHFD